MSTPAETAHSTRRTTPSARSVQSRRRILDAAMESVARYGIHATTHRSIAQIAGVPHSLTRYFFGSIDELIEATFEHYASRESVETLQLLQETAVQLARAAPEIIAGRLPRSVLTTSIAASLTAYVFDEAHAQRTPILVELNFLCLHNASGSLRAKISAYRQRLVDKIADLLILLDPGLAAQAVTDASLLLTVIHRLQKEAIDRDDPATMTMVREELERIVDLLFVVRLPTAEPRRSDL